MLRRHIRRRAKQLPRPSQPLRRRLIPGSDPKIDETQLRLDARRPLNQDVIRLEIPMNDPALMRLRQRPHDRQHQPRRMPSGQGTPLCQHRRQIRRLIHQLQHQIGPIAVDHPEAINLDHRRMPQPRHQPRLALEPSHLRLERLPQHLDRHLAIQRIVERAINPRHAATADGFDEPVSPTEVSTRRRRLVDQVHVSVRKITARQHRTDQTLSARQPPRS